MKVYYLFDGNEAKDFIVDQEDRELECMNVFEDRAKKGRYVHHEWLQERIVVIALEGKMFNENNVLYTISINNRPTRAIVNPTTEDKAELFEYYLENSDDYKNCKIVKNIVL